MKYLPCLVFFLLPFMLSAQDHLEPCTDAFSTFLYKNNYHLKVREILFDSASPRPEIQLVVIPSFSNEIVWQIFKDKDSGEHVARLSSGTESIWYSQYKEDDSVNLSAVVTWKEIGAESVDVIKALFTAAMGTVRYPEEKGSIGFDGTNYYFSVFNYGYRTGTIWSPKKDSKMDRLVKIGYELIALTQSGDEPLILDKTLQESIKSLTAELK